MAIDPSPRMLARAGVRAAHLGLQIDLREAGVQSLPFPEAGFDTAIATCVFCSMPDPFRAFEALRCVSVPGGQLLPLEHVLSHRAVAARLMNLANPLVVCPVGADVNRRAGDAPRPGAAGLSRAADAAGSPACRGLTPVPQEAISGASAPPQLCRLLSPRWKRP